MAKTYTDVIRRDPLRVRSVLVVIELGREGCHWCVGGLCDQVL